MDVELQQHRGVIGGPDSVLRLNSTQVQLGQDWPLNECINDPDRVVLRNVLILRS